MTEVLEGVGLVRLRLFAELPRVGVLGNQFPALGLLGNWRNVEKAHNKGGRGNPFGP
jgi:hypothetical protein